MHAVDARDEGPDRTRASGALRRLVAATVVVAVALVSVQYDAMRPAGAAGCAAGSTVDSVEASAESAFRSKLNSLRSSRGLGSLVHNSAITGPAREWSQTMAGQDWLHHAVDTGAGDGVTATQDYGYQVSRAVPDWRAMAENVGVGDVRWCSTAELQSSAAAAVDRLHRAFVNSSGHFANMIGDYNQVGIGVHIDSRKLWVTVRFVRGSVPVQMSAATGRYLDAVHVLFVKRHATSAEKTKWAGPVQTGNRSAVTKALAVSDEWAGVRVNDLYRTVLGRSADASGRSYWVSQIAYGARLEDVAAGFYAGREYFIRNGSTNRGFVTGLYEDILGRRPDASGLRHWVGALDRGELTRLAAAASFYASIESRRDRVDTLYREILGRSPDATGWRYWAGQLLWTGDVELAAYLASSEEYYRRATR